MCSAIAFIADLLSPGDYVRSSDLQLNEVLHKVVNLIEAAIMVSTSFDQLLSQLYRLSQQ